MYCIINLMRLAQIGFSFRFMLICSLARLQFWINISIKKIVPFKKERSRKRGGSFQLYLTNSGREKNSAGNLSSIIKLEAMYLAQTFHIFIQHLSNFVHTPFVVFQAQKFYYFAYSLELELLLFRRN